MEDSEKFKKIFSDLKAIELEPSPFLKTRVLAHVREQTHLQKKLVMWKAISAGLFLVALFFGVISVRNLNQPVIDGVAGKPYVIQVEFSKEDLATIAQAEIQLDDQVYFVTAQNEIRNLRLLTLPVSVKMVGRGKLPFVVMSGTAGRKEIKIRLFDLKHCKVREQSMKFNFTEQES